MMGVRAPDLATSPSEVGGVRRMCLRRIVGVFAVSLLFHFPATAETLDDGDAWRDIAGDGKSLVFGRFVGKFESTQFRSRRIRLREINTGDTEELEVGDGLGLISEKIPPGIYDVLGFEAIFYPRPTGPLRPDRHRPIRQRFAINPKTGDSKTSRILVPKNRPVYIGTIQADNPFDGMVYRGHQLRVYDDYDEAFERLSTSYPALTGSLERNGIVPARHFMLKPTRRPPALERVVGLEDPIRQAREYIRDGKYQQAITWLETFMPASDEERSEANLLVGEAYLGDGLYPEAIEELGEVLLFDANDTRALRLLARAHALYGNLEDAQNLYEALSEMVPGDAESHLHLGYLYALQGESERSRDEFRAAFEKDFDYLLHDLAPFLIAVREALAEGSGEYLPPRVIRYSVPPPRTMESRRASATNGFSVLIDHEGRVIAAHLASLSRGSTPMMMLSLVKATYEPASLNGIPIPALVSVGAPGVSSQ